MRSQSRSTMLVLLGLVTFGYSAAAHHSFSASYRDATLPTGVAESYSKMVGKHTAEASLFFFDKSGKVKDSVPLSHFGKQMTIDDFIKKAPGTPIAACENPKPITPPPPCAICKNGVVICTSPALK